MGTCGTLRSNAGVYTGLLLNTVKSIVRQVVLKFNFVWTVLAESLTRQYSLQSQPTVCITFSSLSPSGCSLNDSPVGLAAYILEKFSTWTDEEFRDHEDGGLERKFSLDDLLTNVMIYWLTGSIVSSMRFYKENVGKGIGVAKHEK
ncbi:hypothetical protein FKM82_018565 [Ascaphus truei]